jgi:hypothetical protein
MHLHARLDEATLRAILDELLPVTILLDDGGPPGSAREGRWVRIEPTHLVDFVEDEGLRLATRGQIRWTGAGVPIEATLQDVRILLRPEIAPGKTGGRLVFRPSLESADLKNVPSFIDRGIVAMINRTLEARGDDLAWDFGKSLGFAVPAPRALHGIAAIQMDAQNASVRVLHDAIELGLSLSLHFRRVPGD